MRHVWPVVKRTVISFYDDQITHHSAAITYYSLMSLFPTLLLALALLGLIGEYPTTYDAILAYLAKVVPHSTLTAIDAALRNALRHKGTAAGALVVAVVIAFYGTTGVLEAIRRALNVVFEVEHGRSFLVRKATDIVSTIVLMGLGIATLVLMFVGGGFARDIFGFFGLGSTATAVWDVLRWPAALLVAMLMFSAIYYVTPDVKQRAFRWVTPGAAAGVCGWLLVSAGFSYYLAHYGGVSATYGSLAAAIVLVVWLWLSSVSLLSGAVLNAEIERERELAAGVPKAETLTLPDAGEDEPRAQPDQERASSGPA